MNRKGHVESLIAAHPDNQNATKAGVFSSAALAPRVHELDAAIAARPPQDVARDLLRRELAALAGLGEAMDRSLEDDGIRGRRVDPRTLISLRLRLNEKLRRTLEEFERATGCVDADGRDERPSLNEDAAIKGSVPERLSATVARLHLRPSINAIGAHDLDPEQFLRAVIITTDPLVATRERLRARRLLTRRRSNRPVTCVCFATLRSHHPLELRGWIEAYREAGLETSESDPGDAATVRVIARGDRAEFQRRNWRRYVHTIEAFDDVVRRAVADAIGEASTAGDELDAQEYDMDVLPFWRILLSPDEALATKLRLDAFAALDEMSVLRKCSCNAEGLHRSGATDKLRAWTIRMVAQKHYRAAAVIARNPETYLALRDAIDDAIVAERVPA